MLKAGLDKGAFGVHHKWSEVKDVSCLDRLQTATAQVASAIFWELKGMNRMLSGLLLPNQTRGSCMI